MAGQGVGEPENLEFRPPPVGLLPGPPVGLLPGPPVGLLPGPPVGLLPGPPVGRFGGGQFSSRRGHQPVRVGRSRVQPAQLLSRSHHGGPLPGLVQLANLSLPPDDQLLLAGVICALLDILVARVDIGDHGERREGLVPVPGLGGGAGQRVVVGQVPGLPVGVLPGLPVGVLPGLPVGVLPGLPVGVLPGLPVGVLPGLPVGVLPGLPVGVLPGLPVGVLPGLPVGVLPGLPVGVLPGLPVGVLPGRPGQVEQAPVGCPRVQDRRAPFGEVALVADRPPGLGQGSFQRVAVGDRPVELAGEDDRRVVGDLELHRHHRGQALLDQALRHPGERVAGTAAGTLAGVQHRQAGLVVFAEQAAELLTGYLLGPPVAVLHDQHAVAPVGPVTAVADEMENVELVAAQPLPQRRSCWQPAAR